jgi:hypothetical protein
VKTIVPHSHRHAAVAAPSPAKPARPAAHPKKRAAQKAPAKAAAPTHAPAARTEPNPAPKPKPKPLANPYHLPVPLARALAAHDTVVVGLYSPESRVDTIAYAEARAGAELAAGDVVFLGVSVLDPAQVRNLTEQLGVLSDPGVLIYRRPGTLAVRIDGFADRETVAQAAENARTGS